MAKTQTLEDFYRHKFNWLPENLKKDIGHFNVFKMEDTQNRERRPVQYRRRDFYKIALVKGDYLYHYANKTLEVKGPTLMFFNPMVPYTCEQLTENLSGYFCIFREAFLTEHFRGGIKEFPMFVPGGTPGYTLTEEMTEQVSQVFEKMLEEMKSDYVYKYDLIRNYIMEIIHLALKIQPKETIYHNVDANSRLTSVFSELLERQFPIETPAQRFTMRSASDFAEKLAVHVNHLNRAIRTTTGKTTTVHIFERLTSEALALLKHTDWNISEISYCLGFEEPAHFNHFFKKQTGTTPSTVRS